MNTNLIFIIVLLSIGIILRRLRVFPETAAQSFNTFIIYVSFPAVVLLQLPKLQYSRDLIGVVITPWIALILSVILVIIFSKLFNISRSMKGALLMMVPLGNTSFLGIPMIESFFGSKGIPHAILYDQLGSFLALSIYGTFIISLYTSDKKLELKPLLKRFLTFPPFLSLVLAISLRGTTYPDSVTYMLKTLAGTLVPLAMIAVGYQLKLKLPKKSYFALGFGLMAKLIITPLLILILVKGLGMNTFPMKVAIMEAGMPPMISAGAVAIGADLEPELVASLVGIGLIISLITLPILHLLL